MPFKFNNKAPPRANAFGAFKALPGLPNGKQGLLPSSAAPSITKKPSPAPSKTDAASPRLSFAPRTAVADGTSIAEQSSALEFFRHIVSNEQRPQKGIFSDRKQSRAGNTPESDSARFCICEELKPNQTAAELHCLPNTAAHIFKDHCKPFRFLDLPAEMRNRVYQACLAPGYISMRTCVHNFPLAVTAELTRGITAANKQLARESKGFLLENTVIVNISLRGGSRPVFDRDLIPQHIVPQIKHITMVVDFSRTESITESTEGEVWEPGDWRPVQQLTGLTTLRICGVMAPGSPHFGSISYVIEYSLKEVLERVPSDCKVSYGEQSAEEEEHVNDMMLRMMVYADERRAGGSYGYLDNVEVINPSELATRAEMIKKDVVQGSKSGSTVDLRFVPSGGKKN